MLHHSLIAPIRSTRQRELEIRFTSIMTEYISRKTPTVSTSTFSFPQELLKFLGHVLVRNTGTLNVLEESTNMCE